ncbi:MAG: CDP-alcohol phosphatidyltransferase family protein [Bacilli bacterium]|nr:CDP-alcohol phosphatidyltransferase family protein [Bacilli bacterium]
MFIGKYNKSACVTYLGTISSIIGMIMAMNQKIKISIICLVASGVFDMFDGRIARKDKNRTESDKNYGVEIDSLSDTICFVVLPIIIFYQMGMQNWYNICIYILYGLAGIIRLAYFNINTSNSEPIKKYTGLPVTSAAIIIPSVFLLSLGLERTAYNTIATIVMALVGILFISKIKIPKPKGKIIYFFLGAAILFIALMLGIV